MEAYLEGWNEFNVAMMGATAALAGLLIVAASVNVADIVKAPEIAARLAAGLAGLVLAIVTSAVGLIPHIPSTAYGAAVIASALISAVFSIQATRRIYANTHPANRMRATKSAVGFVAPACYLVGGVLTAIGVPPGIALFAAGAIAAIVAGILISWVALVEVLR